MPPAKKQRRASDDESEVEGARGSDISRDAGSEDERYGDFSGPESSGGEGSDSPDTEDEIADAKRPKSKQTLKRKRRATDATRFGATLQFLLSTDAPSAQPLSLKPSIARKRNDEKLEAKGKKVLLIERKEKEEKGRIKDAIGGWGGEGERALRKVAQRGVIKLFNVIQQAQAQVTAAEEGLKAQRGSGKPTLAAPSLAKGKGKGKKKEKQAGNLLGRPSEALVGEDDFLNSIRSGEIVAKS
ncbi:Rrp15p domain-containing protein [Phanerochaete sordida]|uniref:Rrp15p domain-containing protein n=1 Tax=Phanerochaete sordida TaxID=48140 RepID=A0A9P3L970_9APHY|nr:Rrp15p domain-containing protein [Phanerochaete sordida]